ncbi:hypothetical protein [Endozoicomonas sp. 8E]|uniref:hypothetical protein n=1 Tax=Endozoicomonas sp. 8E TaxID=3035692 RepID=UPI0029392F32|nr:hypothetical protein [Endozoicomonas sp. 8E]WOG30058.1 hypothetical protein P6910_10505 [Endozoicomonas sp. 8E]
MFFLRGLLFVFLSLLLVASCWGSAESPEQKAARNVRDNLNSLYFDYVFAEENEKLLKAIMVSVRQVYDSYEQDQGAQDRSFPGSQTETRQQFLTRLVQQAVRHTISKVTGSDSPDHPMFHLLLNKAPGMEESPDVARWYRTRPVLLQGVSAEDRTDSIESLIEEAVQNSFREFPSNPLSQEKLSRQLGFILVEMQELFLRGKALRHLGYRVDEQKQDPEIARDPAFVLYVSSLTELFNNHPTLWHTDSERRQYQKDLSALFMEAAGREDYGIEWYQQVRRVLEGNKPVTYHPGVQDAANDESQSKKQVTYHPRSPYDLEYLNYKALLLPCALFGGFLIGVMSVVIADGQMLSQNEQWAWESQQAGELQRKLGKALDKPWREDWDVRDWEPDSRDREKVREIMKGFDRRITEKLLIRAGALDPYSCNMGMTNLHMQISLLKLYAHLWEHNYILTKEVKRRWEMEQEEAEEGVRTTTCTGTTHRRKEQSSSSSQQRERGFTRWGTPTTSEVKCRKAAWS